MNTITRNALLLLASVVAVLTCLQPVLAQAPVQPQTEAFEYFQGFETDADPLQFWTSYDKKYTVNFKGPTTEKARSGKQSFKLDITFNEPSRFLWHIPMEGNVPVGGKLAFSGHMLLGEETTGTATLGVSFRFPPTKFSGCTAPGRFYGATEGEWVTLGSDVVRRGREIANSIVTTRMEGVTGEHVGVFLERIIFDLHGQAGQRVVLYADDLAIRGEIPTPAAYRDEITRRWSAMKEELDEKLSAWDTILDEAGTALAQFAELTPRAERLRGELVAGVAEAKTNVQAARDAGQIDRLKQDEIMSVIAQLRGISTINAISKAEREGQAALLYVVPPVSSAMILPDQAGVPGVVSSELSVVAARGEYEPASFVVSPMADINDLSVVVGDLQGDGGTIPGSAVDVKVIKCWYQAGTAWTGIRQDKSRSILTPELLLNDDSLVRADEEKQGNHLKLSFPEGEKYVWISDPTDRKDGALPVAEFPVKDSPVLLPVDISEGRNKQFWLTVHVPGDAEPGAYTGTISLKTPDATIADLTLKLDVLPFELLPPYYNSSIDYHGRPGPGEGTISSWGKSWAQFRAELENMIAHGLSNCQHYSIKPDMLEGVLKVREEVGMDNRTLYLKSTIPIGNPTDPQALQTIKDDVRSVIELTKQYGTETVHFYGIDEVTGEELTAQRPAWNAVREAGGKIFVAGGGDNIELVGDIQDVHVRAGWPNAEEVARWHAYGHRIFSYANPQTGVENPVVYRRNFGLLLWKYEYDGASTNAYQHTFGTTWNDFDHPTYRAHTIAYPTMDGVIDTIAWEGYREGVDDVRYMTTLQAAIEAAQGSEEPETQRKVEAANDYLRDLKSGTAIETDDLDGIRGQIITHILALQTPE